MSAELEGLGGALAEWGSLVEQRLAAHESRLADLEAGQEQPPPPDPDPPTQIHALPYLPIPLVNSGIGAGNKTVTDAKDVQIRCVPLEPGKGLRGAAVRLKAKGWKLQNGAVVVESGYGDGDPTARIGVHACTPTGGLGAELAAWEGKVRTLIPGGNLRIPGLDWPLDEPFIIRAAKVGGTGFYSINCMRSDPASGQTEHYSDEWDLLGERSRCGLDRAMAVRSGNAWGSPYSGSEPFVVWPTYAIERSDGKVEGQPFYGGWGNPDGSTVWTALRACTITGVRACGSGTVTLHRNGVQVASVSVASGVLTNLGTPVALAAGEAIEVRHPSGSFPGLAADAALWSAIGSSLIPRHTSDGVAPIGLVAS